MWRIYLSLLALFFSACKSAPKAEMERAQKAIEEARKVNAPHYAPADFQVARESYDKAEKQILEKEYDEAKKNAIEAEKFAQKSYYASLNNFTTEKKRIVAEAQRKAKSENAHILFAEKFSEVENLEKELKQDIEKLQELSSKLKKLEEEKKASLEKK